MMAPVAACAAISGIVFALGLLIADMTSPGRIVGFLDVGGDWDPTLAFVMAGAIAVYAPLAQLARRRPRPIFGGRFHWPEANDLDARLIAGSMMFGVGWGLSGYCPGPALVAVGTGNLDTLLFVACVIAGIVLARYLQRDRSSSRATS